MSQIYTNFHNPLKGETDVEKIIKKRIEEIKKESQISEERIRDIEALKQMLDGMLELHNGTTTEAMLNDLQEVLKKHGVNNHYKIATVALVYLFNIWSL